MLYDNSHYNYFYEDETSTLRLYNSKTGLNSLLKVNGEQKALVYNIFSDPNNPLYHDTPEFKHLIELGFIHSVTEDEKQLISIKKNDIVNDSCLQLVIMPTEECNFRCKYCYEDHTNGKMSIELQNAIIKYIQKHIHKYTQLHISWFGGEPLEAVDVIEYISRRAIDICKIARKNYSADMTTNGFNLTKPIFEHLLKMRIFSYQITIDGPQFIHDNLRVLKNSEKTFDKIISNIDSIQEIKSTLFRVRIRTNLTRDIHDCLDEYIKLLEKICSDSRFSAYASLVSDWGGLEVKSISDSLLSLNDYSAILKLLSKNTNKINFSAHLSDIDCRTSVCYAGSRNCFVIGSDGTIYKCTEDFNMEENKIGSITENGEMELDYTKLAKWVTLPDSVTSEQCNSCKFFGCCLGRSCPKSIIMHGKNRTCPITKNLIYDFLDLLNLNCFQPI